MGCNCGGGRSSTRSGGAASRNGVRYYKILVGGAEKARAGDWATAKRKREKYSRLGNRTVQIVTNQGQSVDESGNPK